MTKHKQPLIEEKQQADFFKILSHPVRIAILNLLGEEEACVCHLEAVLGYRQAYLSQQLAVLRENNFIQDRKDGWNVFYQLTNPELLTLIHQSAQYLQLTLEDTKLDPKDCPCPKCAVKKPHQSCC